MTVEQLRELARLGLVRLVGRCSAGDVYELTHAGLVLADQREVPPTSEQYPRGDCEIPRQR